MSDGLPPFELDPANPPDGLSDMGVTIVSLDPYMAVLSLVTLNGKRYEFGVDRGAAAMAIRGLVDFLGTDPEELRQATN